MAETADIRLTRARELVEAFEGGDTDQAERIVDELSRAQESNLFQQLGKLTRELHETLSNFQIDSRLVDLAGKEIPDAKERLNHVVTMTEEATHKTLTAVEGSLPRAEHLGKTAAQLKDAWGRFRNREMSAEEFRVLSRDIETFLGQVGSDADTIREDLTAVMMAQSAQDLTGQIIRRVVTLVHDLEESLVQLVRMSGMRLLLDGAGAPAPEAETDKKSSSGHGPVVPSVDKGNVVTSQDEVDDLLSSLGF
jgi:chemotaxis protein CheZ